MVFGLSGIYTERGLTQRLTMLLIEYVFTHSGPTAAVCLASGSVAFLEAASRRGFKLVGSLPLSIIGLLEIRHQSRQKGRSLLPLTRASFALDIHAPDSLRIWGWPSARK